MTKHLLIKLLAACACVTQLGCSSNTDPQSSTTTKGTDAPSSTTSSTSQSTVTGKENLPPDFPIALDKAATKVELDEAEEHEYKFDVSTTLPETDVDSYYTSAFRKAGWTVTEGLPTKVPLYDRGFSASTPKKSVLVLIAKDGSGSKVHFDFSDIDDEKAADPTTSETNASQGQADAE